MARSAAEKLKSTLKWGSLGPQKSKKTRSAYWLELPEIRLHATCCSARDSLVDYYRVSR